MPTVTTKDGTEIFYKDWGSGQPIVFSHGWPLSADDWDAQLLFFLRHGYRVIARDRRGHGRSTQTADGHDMDHYADDLAALTAHLDLKNAIHVGHSTGGGEVELRKRQSKDVEGRQISRRRFLAVSGVGAVLLARRPVIAAEDGIVPTMVNAAANAKIFTKTLRRNISVLEGSGGNIAVLSGRDGKLLVDAGFTVSRPALSTALTAISADPIKQLINTHWHTDHTDGNAWLHDAGAAIMAHENTRKHLSVASRVEAWNYTFPAAPSGAIPAKVFKTNSEMRWNDTRLLLQYYGPAHTDSDISVNFTDADVLHVGDTWWNGIYPFIDYSTGGSIDGSIRAAEANLRAVTSKTIVIPGHGPVGGKSEMTEFRDMLVAIREKVAALKKQGRSLDAAITAKPTAAYDAKWGQFLITPAMFTGLVYQGV